MNCYESSPIGRVALFDFEEEQGEEEEQQVLFQQDLLDSEKDWMSFEYPASPFGSDESFVDSSTCVPSLSPSAVLIPTAVRLDQQTGAVKVYCVHSTSRSWVLLRIARPSVLMAVSRPVRSGASSSRCQSWEFFSSLQENLLLFIDLLFIAFEFKSNVSPFTFGKADRGSLILSVAEVVLDDNPTPPDFTRLNEQRASAWKTFEVAVKDYLAKLVASESRVSRLSDFFRFSARSKVADIMETLMNVLNTTGLDRETFVDLVDQFVLSGSRVGGSRPLFTAPGSEFGFDSSKMLFKPQLLADEMARLERASGPNFEFMPTALNSYTTAYFWGLFAAARFTTLMQHDARTREYMAALAYTGPVCWKTFSTKWAPGHFLLSNQAKESGLALFHFFHVRRPKSRGGGDGDDDDGDDSDRSRSPETPFFTDDDVQEVPNGHLVLSYGAIGDAIYPVTLPRSEEEVVSGAFPGVVSDLVHWRKVCFAARCPETGTVFIAERKSQDLLGVHAFLVRFPDEKEEESVSSVREVVLSCMEKTLDLTFSLSVCHFDDESAMLDGVCGFLSDARAPVVVCSDAQSSLSSLLDDAGAPVVCLDLETVSRVSSNCEVDFEEFFRSVADLEHGDEVFFAMIKADLLDGEDSQWNRLVLTFCKCMLATSMMESRNVQSLVLATLGTMSRIGFSGAHPSLEDLVSAAGSWARLAPVGGSIARAQLRTRKDDEKGEEAPCNFFPLSDTILFADGDEIGNRIQLEIAGLEKVIISEQYKVLGLLQKFFPSVVSFVPMDIHEKYLCHVAPLGNPVVFLTQDEEQRNRAFTASRWTLLDFPMQDLWAGRHHQEFISEFFESSRPAVVKPQPGNPLIVLLSRFVAESPTPPSRPEDLRSYYHLREQYLLARKRKLQGGLSDIVTQNVAIALMDNPGYMEQLQGPVAVNIPILNSEKSMLGDFLQLPVLTLEFSVAAFKKSRERPVVYTNVFFNSCVSKMACSTERQANDNNNNNNNNSDEEEEEEDGDRTPPRLPQPPFAPFEGSAATPGPETSVIFPCFFRRLLARIATVVTLPIQDLDPRSVASWITHEMTIGAAAPTPCSMVLGMSGPCPKFIIDLPGLKGQSVQCLMQIAKLHPRFNGLDSFVNRFSRDMLEFRRSEERAWVGGWSVAPHQSYRHRKRRVIVQKDCESTSDSSLSSSLSSSGSEFGSPFTEGFPRKRAAVEGPRIREKRALQAKEEAAQMTQNAIDANELGELLEKLRVSVGPTGSNDISGRDAGYLDRDAIEGFVCDIWIRFKGTLCRFPVAQRPLVSALAAVLCHYFYATGGAVGRQLDDALSLFEPPGPDSTFDLGTVKDVLGLDHEHLAVSIERGLDDEFLSAGRHSVCSCVVCSWFPSWFRAHVASAMGLEPQTPLF